MKNNKDKFTTVRISTKTKEMLDNLREYPKQPYEELINHLALFLEKTKLEDNLIKPRSKEKK